jgi:hypothetical protein
MARESKGHKREPVTAFLNHKGTKKAGIKGFLMPAFFVSLCLCGLKHLGFLRAALTQVLRTVREAVGRRYFLVFFFPSKFFL